MNEILIKQSGNLESVLEIIPVINAFKRVYNGIIHIETDEQYLELVKRFRNINHIIFPGSDIVIGSDTQIIDLNGKYPGEYNSVMGSVTIEPEDYEYKICSSSIRSCCGSESTVLISPPPYGFDRSPFMRSLERVAEVNRDSSVVVYSDDKRFNQCFPNVYRYSLTIPTLLSLVKYGQAVITYTPDIAILAECLGSVYTYLESYELL